MKKSIKVYTNDPKKEKISLHLAGKVKNFATIKPSKVFLKGNVGESISKTVSIIPGEGEVFKVLHVNALKDGNIEYTLKENEINGKKAYELVVENVRATEGRYFDKIFLITDRTDQPPISIIVSGQIVKPEAPEVKQKGAPAVPENKPKAPAE